jgi:hypothetical protein
MNRVVNNKKGQIIICSLSENAPPCTLLVCLGDFQVISPNQKKYRYFYDSQNCSLTLKNIETQRCEHILSVKCVI